MADTKDTKAEQARQEKLAASSPTRDDQPDPRASTEVKPREARAIGPSRIDDPARTEAGKGTRVNLPEREMERTRGEPTEPTPIGTPAANGQTYTYRVIERAFKENLLMDPTNMPEDSGGLFQSQHVYNSRALEPADDVTREAVAKLKEEHDQLRGQSGPISREEANDLRNDIAELRALLAESRGGGTRTPAAAKRAAPAEEETGSKAASRDEDNRGSKKS